MPKFLDVPTWYGSSNTTLLSLWTTSGTSGQLLRSAGNGNVPTWGSFRKNNLTASTISFRAVCGVSSSTGSASAYGCLYVFVPELVQTVSNLREYLQDNNFDGTYDDQDMSASFLPVFGSCFYSYNSTTAGVVLICGIGSNSGSFRFLQQDMNFTSGGIAGAQWEAAPGVLYDLATSYGPIEYFDVVTSVSIS